MVGVSPATALRRVKRLTDAGLIEKQVAVLQPDRLAEHTGHGLTAIAEISLDKQGAEHLDAFEGILLGEPEVQQCYRVSPGPDFVVVLTVRDMPGYHALAQRVFTQQANVRNVRTFFSVKRTKFGTALPLPHTL
jgi:DNA-binding Lrp family transcriptional regulator